MTGPAVPVALSIAGSDPSGGAGVQADLKTFAALGAYGTCVLTALTAQNTRSVTGVHAVPAAFVAEQLDTLLADVEVHATKIGMLADAGIARVVAAAVAGRGLGPVVLDPVMVATSGDPLLAPDAVAVVRDELVPLADLVTPNTAEAALLLGGDEARDLSELVGQAEALHARTGTAVLLKGGHLAVDAGSAPGADQVVDVLAGPGGPEVLSRPRVDTTGTHGTGCTLSAAVAAGVAAEVLRTGVPGEWYPAVAAARDYLQSALVAGRNLGIGTGHGPVAHSPQWWAAAG